MTDMKINLLKRVVVYNDKKKECEDFAIKFSNLNRNFSLFLPIMICIAVPKNKQKPHITYNKLTVCINTVALVLDVKINLPPIVTS